MYKQITTTVNTYMVVRNSKQGKKESEVPHKSNQLKSATLEITISIVYSFSTKNTLGVKKEWPRTKKKKKGLDKKEVRSKWAAKGQCSVSADGIKILIITIQAAKH